MKKYDTGSFRDPAGRIFYSNNKVYREINEQGKKRLAFLKNGLLDDLLKNNFLIETKILNKNKKNIILQHKKIKFISYPYEWTFNQLKDAAIFHLDFQIYLLKKNAKLIDATPYNIQFINNKPIFIDALSISKYKDGDYWFGHNQFIESFLNPLLLKAKKGVNFNNWFKGNLEGISTEDIFNILNFKDFISPTIFINIYLLHKAHLKSKINFYNKSSIKQKFNKNSYFFLLKNLKNYIKKLKPKHQLSNWENYSKDHFYKNNEETTKFNVVNNFIKKKKIKFLADLGCNDGKFSEYASKNKTQVIGFDFDLNVIDKSYLKAKKENKNFFPIYSDFSNPSGDIGWNNVERKSLQKRSKFDGLIALALIHHLCLGKNIPIDQVIKWIVSFAPTGLIEFVPKNDPTSKIMLSLKGDIFPHYNEKNFTKILKSHVNIKNISLITNTKRKIYEYEK